MIDEWAIPENLPAVLNISINEVMFADDLFISYSHIMIRLEKSGTN